MNTFILKSIISGKSVPSFEKFLSQRSQITSHDYNGDNSFPLKGEPIPKSANVDKLRDKKLLKELHADKMYFEKLMRNPGEFSSYTLNIRRVRLGFRIKTRSK